MAKANLQNYVFSPALKDGVMPTVKDRLGLYDGLTFASKPEKAGISR